MPAEPLVEVRGLTVSFPGEREDVVALKDFDLTIGQGEIVGLIGETGCGKSTAALALLGLIKPPGRRRAGTVRFEGRDLFAMAEPEVRAIRGGRIGLIVQNPRASLSPLHAIGEQIVNVYQAHNPAGRVPAVAHAVDMLRTVGINDPERRFAAYPHEISGGMAQRVLIAMALSSRPHLLVADEPTSGLDVTIQAQFLDQMWRTVRDTGSAVLLVTQDLGIIANYCDRIAVMHDGRIAEEGPVKDFFAAPQHAYSRSILALQVEDETPGENAGAVGETPLVEVANLAKRFPVRGSSAVVQAVDQVSFAIMPGETLGLVGESGSGKTTVGRCLLQLTQPDGGEIRFRGDPIRGADPASLRKLRARMQIVFQDPFDSLNPRWSVGDVLAEPLDLHAKLDRAGRAARVAELLRLVDLDPAIVDTRPKALSAGWQQRIGIARALATEPELIVLDEPTSALAPAARVNLIKLLRDLQRRMGLAFLFISHDLTTVRSLCHRVAVMYLSQVVEIGSRDQIFGNPLHPYSRALLSAHLAPDPHNRRVDRAVTAKLEGEIPSPIDLPQGCYLFGRCPSQVEECRTMPQVLTAQPDGRSARCWRIGV